MATTTVARPSAPGVIWRGANPVARPYNRKTKKHEWLKEFDGADEFAFADAAALARDFLKGIVSAPTKLTCGDLVDKWLAAHVPTLKENTRKTYRQNIVKFRADFADVPVADCDHDRLQLWANGVKRYQGVVAKYVFTWALDTRKIDVDPMAKVKFPRREEREPDILTLAQINDLAEKALAIHDEPMASRIAALVKFTAGTGLRPSEYDRLYWRDIDLAAGVAYVAPSKNWKDGRVVLTPLAVEALTMIPRGLPDELVFPNSKGKPLAKSGLTYWWSPVRKAAGLPKFKFRNLRHTCGTLMAEAGCSAAAIAMQLRHSDVGSTAEKFYIRPRERVLSDEIRAKIGSTMSAARVEPGRVPVATGSDAA